MSVFKRKPKARKAEAKKAKKKYVDSSEHQNLCNRLGLRQDAPREKIIFELNRLRYKSEATWKALKLTEKDFEDFGLEHR